MIQSISDVKISAGSGILFLLYVIFRLIFVQNRPSQSTILAELREAGVQQFLAPCACSIIDYNSRVAKNQDTQKILNFETILSYAGKFFCEVSWMVKPTCKSPCAL